ncbi:complex I subunit 5 family protein [Rubellimicrobium roseum]|uniref:Monovalent cation/H+ antiporter subunit D family protein n=1 Tax=Rubellimicrobium roseum TaxID=687525 RepID=A0A5C4N673_9RHOB|nr:proton-conducting transporter membrane subunit [Rubellimicrobium roseum]TNC65807.1 monovalent cation/H+ antiporter subunit D family protein [Rubellimicrobium roseum]
MTEAWLPLAILGTSLLVSPIIFSLPEERVRTRTLLNLGAATLKLALVAWLAWRVGFRGAAYEARLPFVPGIDLVLRADPLAVLFVSLSSALWLLTTIYAVGYLDGAPNRSRFFGFFSLCVASTIGIAMAGNLLTFLLFYELLTIATYPLVVHRETPEARRAGRIYLAYTLGGGVLVLAGTAWLWAAAGTLDFVPQGVLAGTTLDGATLVAIFLLLVGGLAVKAAMVPVHGWLPIAMVAPAPVSALLHAVAVVKAGAFGIIRVVHEIYGIELATRLGVATPLAALAAFTILYGSVRALGQDDLKKRLAFSTVSQVSYVVLGTALFSPLAAIGGLMHLIHQGLMKITMFMCAGNIAETLHVYKVSGLDGVGRRLPWTMGAFTVAALGMIGVPPLAGFVSKWYLAAGGLDAGAPWVVAVLLGSSALNAAYFLPILHRAWFREPPEPWPAPPPGARLEAPWMLLLPPLATGLLVAAAGLLASAPISPLGWARFIATGEIPGLPGGLIQ